jgi:hypothetical protein
LRRLVRAALPFALGEQAIELINIGLLSIQASATFQALIDACFNFPSLAGLYKYATYDAMKRKQQSRVQGAPRGPGRRPTIGSALPSCRRPDGSRLEGSGCGGSAAEPAASPACGRGDPMRHRRSRRRR